MLSSKWPRFVFEYLSRIKAKKLSKVVYFIGKDVANRCFDAKKVKKGKKDFLAFFVLGCRAEKKVCHKQCDQIWRYFATLAHL